MISVYFSWHLWSVLSAFGYSHTSSSFLVSLHTSFSAQLEAAGLWQWAVFVVQHVDTPTDRYQLVREILCRHCLSNGEPTEEEGFVIEELQVPKELVYLAKVSLERESGELEREGGIVREGVWG